MVSKKSPSYAVAGFEAKDANATQLRIEVRRVQIPTVKSAMTQIDPQNAMLTRVELVPHK
jgi:hypothetical protein